jgi:hypothetical protein
MLPLLSAYIVTARLYASPHTSSNFFQKALTNVLSQYCLLDTCHTVALCTESYLGCITHPSPKTTPLTFVMFNPLPSLPQYVAIYRQPTVPPEGTIYSPQKTSQIISCWQSCSCWTDTYLQSTPGFTQSVYVTAGQRQPHV